MRMKKQFKELKVGDFFRERTHVMFCYKKSSEFPCAVSLGGALPPRDDLQTNKIEMFIPSKENYAEAKRWIEYGYSNRQLDNLDYIEALAALKKYD
jgi:hypothetical protein